jgi:electron transfer flavoprotein beta subunit
MKILVCIKQVPESNKVEVDPVTGVLKRDGAASKMNPYDLYALETAFRIREEVGGSVHVISMGPPQAQQVIREAFAMGADGGTLAQGIKSCGDFDLILCGKQTTDGDTAQVGPEISEWLNIPSVADVVKINQIDEDGITVSMDLPEEVEVAKVQFPCLLAVDKDIFQPRLPSYVRKMNTKDREIRILSLADMDDKDAMHYGLNGSPTQVQRIFPPAVNDKKEMWDGSGEELADRLYQKIVDMKFV